MKKRCIRLTRPDLGGGELVVEADMDRLLQGDDIRELVEDAEPGARLVLTVSEIDAAELEALPEFDGW